VTRIYNKTLFKERRRELRHSQTDAEKALWKHLRNKGFRGLKFFRQYGVGAYIIDFYCPEYKLAIELDGGQHSDEDIKNYDMARTVYLESLGIRVIRLWNNDVLMNIEGVMEEIIRQVTPMPLARPL
jgi:very-short-patch-repair endonuclease